MEFTKRDTSIIKGIAICMMLWHHLFAFPYKVEAGVFVSLLYFRDTNLSEYLAVFGRMCVPMFTFLSGYGIYRSSLRTEDPSALAARHIARLYTTFWQVFALCLPVIVLLRRGGFSGFVREAVYNFLGLHTTFNEEWWFVFPFALLLILFPCIKRFAERRHASFCSDLLIVLLFNTAAVYVIPSVMELPVFAALSDSVLWKHAEEVMELLPAYAAGCIFARWDVLSRIKTRAGARPLWCAAAVIVMLAIFVIRPQNYKFYDFINAAVFISALTILLPTKPMQFAGRLLDELGTESSGMWLVHSFFCYYWLQSVVYAPKYSPLIFLWLLALSYGTAKLVHAVYKWLGVLAKKAHISN